MSRDRGLPRAKRSLGQNFLIDQNIQRNIVDALDPQPTETVLEIGPGYGALTQHLLGRAQRLVLVELDNALAAQLQKRFADDPAVDVLHRDVLDLALEEVTDAPEALRVIGNIPYNITTPIVFALLERRPRPRDVLLMVQREVAERMTAAPGGKQFGALAVGVQAVAEVETVLQVGRRAFRPVPDVESAVVRITPHVPPRLEPAEEIALRNLSRVAFGRRRKQFQRTLRDAYGLDPAEVQQIEARLGTDLRQRPETFSPAEFVRLARLLPPLPGTTAA